MNVSEGMKSFMKMMLRLNGNWFFEVIDFLEKLFIGVEIMTFIEE